MEAIVSQSSHENPWDVLWTTFDHLTSTHPIITYSLLIIYVAVVMSGFFTMCAHLPGGPSTIPWLPSIYTTDGFLVCCCPLAVVLPIVLWPVILVAAIIQRLFIWFLAAPTYCGIPRRRCRAWLQALVQYPKGCVNGVKKLYSRQRRSGQRPEILPTSNQSSPTPSSGYGTMHGPGPQAGQYRSPSGREGMRYARPPADQSDGSSFRSVPPPYWP